MLRSLYSIYLSVVNRVKDPQRGVGRGIFSPLFVAMLLLATLFWYITKLGYSYTTEIEIDVQIENAHLETSYVAEGIGFKLMGYNLYKGGNIKIPLSELKYKVIKKGEGVKSIKVDRNSLFNAITMRFSDIKIHSIGAIPEIEIKN